MVTKQSFLYVLLSLFSANFSLYGVDTILPESVIDDYVLDFEEIDEKDGYEYVYPEPIQTQQNVDDEYAFITEDSPIPLGNKENEKVYYDYTKNGKKRVDHRINPEDLEDEKAAFLKNYLDVADKLKEEGKAVFFLPLF